MSRRSVSTSTEPKWWAEARALRASAPHLSDAVLGQRFGKTKGAIRRLFNLEYYRAHDASRKNPDYIRTRKYNHKLNLWIEKETYLQLKDLAKENGITISEQMRIFFVWGLEAENND